MPRTRILLSLDQDLYEQLKREAARRRMLPASLAAELVARGIAGSRNADVSDRPPSALKRWLEPYLDGLRESGDWPADVTVEVFDHIRDEAFDLYEAAREEVGRDMLNREIGRMVKERLAARVKKRAGQPMRIKISPKRGSLIKLATLLEPDETR